MITICYQFWSRKENRFKSYEQYFWELDKAVKFCWAMKRRMMILDGISGDSMKEIQYVSKRINIEEINTKSKELLEKYGHYK